MNIENSSKNYNSILSNLSIFELEQVQQDILLSQEHKVKFIFSVDTFDIINYFAPFFDNSFLGKNDIEINNNTIVYEKLYNENVVGTFSKVLLLPEYLFELHSLKSYFENRLKEFQINFKNTIKQNYDDVIKILAKYRNEPNRISIQEYEEITIYLIFNGYDDLIKHFYDFLKEKIMLISDLDSKKYQQVVMHSEDISRKSMRVHEMYAEQFKERVGNLGNGEITEMDVSRHLNNTYIDINVLMSIVSYNERVGPNTDHVILYVSSAQKSNLIANIFEKSNFFCRIQSVEAFNNVRNAYQVFLLKTVLSTKDPTSTIDKIILNKKSIDNSNIFDVEMALKMDREIPISFYNDAYKKYRALLTGKEKINSPDNLEGISASIIDFIDSSSIKNIDLELLVRSFHRKLYLSSLLTPNQKVRLQVRFSEDIVQNSYHHFPYLVFVSSRAEFLSSNKDLYLLLDHITGICDLGKPIEEPTAQILVLINKAIKGNLEKGGKEKKIFDIVSSTKSSLIDKYLFCLLEKKGGTFDNLETRKLYEKDILLDLEKEKVNLSTTIDIKNKNRKNIAQLNLETDMCCEIEYVRLWLLRRNGANIDAIKLGKECIVRYPNDGRFYHGLALAKIEEIYTRINPVIEADNQQQIISEIVRPIKETLELLFVSIDFYKKLLEKKRKSEETVITSLIFKNISAIRNAICDLCIRLYEIYSIRSLDIKEFNGLFQKNNAIKHKYILHEKLYDINDFLRMARVNMDKAIKINRDVDLKRCDILPIFNITEAELNFFESTYHEQFHEFEKAREKNAHACHRCKDLKESLTIRDRFKKIIGKIEDRQKILDGWIRT